MQDSSTWLTRETAARHLTISVRSLDRLCLPQVRLGRRVVYSREVLDAHVSSLMQQGTEARPLLGTRPAGMLRFASGPRRNKKGTWLKSHLSRIPA